MNLLFIRHGKTKGNAEKRYVGRTDEPLSIEGVQALQLAHCPTVEQVFCSPMLRCVQTAQLLYPTHAPIIVPDFQEIDFGDFEYKSYLELQENPLFQQWIDSNGTLPFPNGESQASYCERINNAFTTIAVRCMTKKTVIIAHGGTLMAILSTYGMPKQGYFDYQVSNGEGFQTDIQVTEHKLQLLEIEKWKI